MSPILNAWMFDVDNISVICCNNFKNLSLIKLKTVSQSKLRSAFVFVLLEVFWSEFCDDPSYLIILYFILNAKTSKYFSWVGWILPK
jgi:hypothetical protein